jgi:hypothetical protein
LTKYLQQKKIRVAADATSKHITPNTTLSTALVDGLLLGISEAPKPERVRARAEDATADSAGDGAGASSAALEAASGSSMQAT